MPVTFKNKSYQKWINVSFNIQILIVLYFKWKILQSDFSFKGE